MFQKVFNTGVIVLGFIGLVLFAKSTYAGGLIQDTPFTGDAVTFTFQNITSTSAVQVSTFSITRNWLECRNQGSMEVYITTWAVSGTLINQGFLLSPSTVAVNSIFTTASHGPIYMIGKLGSSVTSGVACREERY